MRTLIALGGNLGDLRASFEGARAAIARLADTRVTATSPRYRTAPLGPPGQPDYLNAVVEIETSIPPEPLLARLHGIEERFGRVRGERWGPRTLDLDLLDFGGAVARTPRLTLPHPRLHERTFVLRPLCDIRSDWHHPLTGRSAPELLDALPDAGATPSGGGEPW